MVGYGIQKMYKVLVVSLGPVAVQYARSQDRLVDITTWHQRLGHISVPRILPMASKGLVDRLNITSKRLTGMCEDCLYSKATRRLFNAEVVHEQEVLQQVHIDLWGPATT